MDTTAGVTGEDRVRTDRQVDYDLEDSADLWKDYGENNIDFRKNRVLVISGNCNQNLCVIL